MLSERPQGSLPGNTELNPREHVKEVTLRSGWKLQSDDSGVPVTYKETEAEVVKEKGIVRPKEMQQEKRGLVEARERRSS